MRGISSVSQGSYVRTLLHAAEVLAAEVIDLLAVCRLPDNDLLTEFDEAEILRDTTTRMLTTSVTSVDRSVFPLELEI